MSSRNVLNSRQVVFGFLFDQPEGSSNSLSYVFVSVYCF